MIKKLFSFFCVLICLWSCKAEKVTIPAYVQIDDYKVITDSLTQGTTNQKFTDMLVFGNGQSCGTFPVGKPIPIIASGPTHILIRGVVEINGVSGVRADYELMAGCDTNITITTGAITKIKPVFKYFTGVVFKLIDNFDVTNPVLNNPNLDTTTKIVSPGIGGTGKCLILMPNPAITVSEVVTTSLNLPSGGVGVYLELNYYSNVAINVSVKGLGSGTSLDVGGVYPSPSGWNKVYFNLTEQVSNLHESANKYSITLYSVYDGSVGANFAKIDNIKVVSKQ
ncbi:MAG: hypothetical protein ABI448_05845 [Bacteroidia bacterium]